MDIFIQRTGTHIIYLFISHYFSSGKHHQVNRIVNFYMFFLFYHYHKKKKIFFTFCNEQRQPTNKRKKFIVTMNVREREGEIERKMIKEMKKMK